MPRKPGQNGGQLRMEDIARRANVAAITVSRVLSTPDKVAEETRRRVLKAIEETGYVPNRIAGSLASSRSHIVAAIVPTIANTAYADVICAMENVLQPRGYHLLLGNSGASLAQERSLIATFLARRPDGMFIHGGPNDPLTRRLLARAEIPLVEAGTLRQDPIDMVVSYSNFAAAKAMAKHVLTTGRRRFGFVSAPTRENDRAMARRRGFLAALKEAGLRLDPTLVVETPHGLAEGGRALNAILDRDPKVDAVFYASDVSAAGGLLECMRRGWPVPERLAISGFDDQAIASQVLPALTTVRVRREEIGRRSAQMILDRIEGKPVNPKVVDVGFELVIRASV